MDEFAYRPASDDDVEWLVKLRIETMSEHIEASGQILTVEEQRQRVLQDFDCIRVMQIEGEPIGMIKVVRRTNPWKLVQIQIVPQHQGQGIGGKVVRALLHEATKTSNSVTLSVLKVNPARHLYERLGFRIAAIKEHAYEMRYEIGDSAA